MTLLQQIIMVSAGVAATMLTRFIPFIAFRPGKPTPKYILYLGKVLPASVFALLVVYCLRHIHSFSADSLAQVAAVAFTILIQKCYGSCHPPVRFNHIMCCQGQSDTKPGFPPAF